MNTAVIQSALALGSPANGVERRPELARYRIVLAGVGERYLLDRQERIAYLLWQPARRAELPTGSEVMKL